MKYIPLAFIVIGLVVPPYLVVDQGTNYLLMILLGFSVNNILRDWVGDYE